MDEEKPNSAPPKRIAQIAMISAVMLWVTGPPLGWWPVAFVAVIPWLFLIATDTPLDRRGYLAIWLTSTVYWLVTLQGLRHAHPAMYLCWILLAAYLAVYHVAFVGICRRAVARRIPLYVAAPIVWVATELIRNYFLTGISAAMLGHALVGVPMMIQIADLFGSYGIGMVLMCCNVATFLQFRRYRGNADRRSMLIATSIASLALIATCGYGYWRLSQPLGEPLATIALLQRDEEVVYEQSGERQEEIFRNYARQAIEAVGESDKPIDLVVWPESMFTGSATWMTAPPNAPVPKEASMTPAEFQAGIVEHQQYFNQRSRSIQQMMIAAKPGRKPPEFLAGCGVIRYDDPIELYSGVVHVGADGDLADWYGKTHLVLVGENIPWISQLPVIGSWIPHLNVGEGGKRMHIAGIDVSPNICIETAVERVTVNQMRALSRTGAVPDVVVTVTNDGWFDDSSIIEHHLRCAQMVAVGIRRPIVSAANNGPTAQINSNGNVVARLATGVNETLIATPRADARDTVYVKIGDIPAWCCVIVTAFFIKRRKVVS
ncbi:Apolipoprotein N-acyltransferase [Rubripirellula tenax]|uniref:Apolipoprotein N-acyltransferase n=1 Tax=Rubripirellula tenax TaxID=2528015 RepID=A0A5C6F0E4_9BACT|nr:apolipoprotein N-acyltransferase [Rubripirellula tenax]TWU54858.1 Apolipoprotein N-acyltransferase [Rubripirellula tenax]